jgi:hypothetical protein
VLSQERQPLLLARDIVANAVLGVDASSMFGLPYFLVFGRDTEHPLLQVLVAQLQELALPNIFLHCDNQGHFEKVLAVVVLAVIRCWCRMLLVGTGEHVLACDTLPIISSEK